MPTRPSAARRALRAKDVLDKLGVKPGDALLVAGTPDAGSVARAR